MAEGIRIPIPAGADLMQPYPVKLPMFEGPLDLLLHLIRRNEVDLRNLPVADICRQYHEYIVLMVELDLEVAAEFLYVEAMLLHIKSQMVLPRAPAVEGEPMEDPRDELVRRSLSTASTRASPSRCTRWKPSASDSGADRPPGSRWGKGRPKRPTSRRSRCSIS